PVEAGDHAQILEEEKDAGGDEHDRGEGRPAGSPRGPRPLLRLGLLNGFLFTHRLPPWSVGIQITNEDRLLHSSFVTRHSLYVLPIPAVSTKIRYRLLGSFKL